MERWQSNQCLQSTEAFERLNACIAFPGGWLIDQYEEEKDAIDEQRILELDYLRKYWLPKVILLLHTVLHNTKKFDRAIQLADLVASEKHRLYEIYTKENMKELLEKIRKVQKSLKRNIISSLSRKSHVISWDICQI